MTLLRERPELLAAFRRGDRAALEEVYWTYVERVERVVRFGFALADRGTFVVGARGSDLADLVQDAFLRAFAPPALQGYDGLRDYWPYLQTIARNLLVDWARKQGRELSLEALGEAATGTLAAPETTAFADAVTMRAVEAYLAALDPTLRAVHEERYVKSRSQLEAAEALGISRQQLRTLETRLREGLRDALRKQRILSSP